MGKQRTHRMLDVIKLMERLQGLNILFNAVLSKRQSCLALFQKNMMIQLSSDSSDEDNKGEAKSWEEIRN